MLSSAFADPEQAGAPRSIHARAIKTTLLLKPPEPEGTSPVFEKPSRSTMQTSAGIDVCQVGVRDDKQQSRSQCGAKIAMIFMAAVKTRCEPPPCLRKCATIALLRRSVA